MKVYKGIISMVLVTFCPRDIFAWSTCPKSRRSILRDQALKIINCYAATQCATPEVAVAAKTLPPAPMTSDSSNLSKGVLLRTARGDSMPATPSSLANIIKEEVLGPVSAASAASSGIICISERHDDTEHHKCQLRVVMAMRKVLNERFQDVSEKLSIGMEMFQRRHQIHLDKYIANEDYSIANLMRDTSWESTWGYDILHYLPLLLYAKRRGIRLLGLHPSDTEVDMVKLHGLNGSQPIIKGVYTNDLEHEANFKAAEGYMLSDYGGCVEAMEKAITRQYEVQCFREEYMAETAAVHMASQPDGWIVLLAGERHILKRNGLPFRAVRRAANIRKTFVSPLATNRGIFTIIPRTGVLPKDVPGVDLADYFWYVQREPENSAFKENEVNLAPLRKLNQQI